MAAMNVQFSAPVARGLKAAARRILDFAMPPNCALTGDAVNETAALSGTGWGALQFIAPPWCSSCGVPFSVDYGEGVLCPSCIASAPDFNRARAAIVYDDASHKLVVGFKHSDRTENAAMFGAWMARAGSDIADRSSILTPVPLHARRLLARRYNQSALLAKAAAHRLGARFAPALLERTRATPPQKQLSAQARQRNVAGAFRVRATSEDSVRGARIVLVDDVLTTGATLSACARTLKKAGAAEVDALVLARVVKGGLGAI